jgi:hypothetical protein
MHIRDEEESRNSNRLNKRERERGRERGCAYLLRKSDSESVFRLHTVRPSGYVDEAKKEE